MPLDPTIPLQVAIPQQASQQGGSTNPLSMMSGFAQTLNALNENRLFQQTFAARQQAGLIIASSPDTETAIQNLNKNPLTAWNAGPYINELRQLELTTAQIANTQAQTRGLLATQGDSALTGIMKVLPAAAGDPTMLDPMIKAKMSVLPQSLQQQVEPGVSAIRDSILAGLPSADEQKSNPAMAQMAQNMFRNRMVGMAIAGNISPDGWRAISGVPTPGVQVGPFGLGGAPMPFQVGGSVFGQQQPMPGIVAGAEGPGGGSLLGLTPGQQAFQTNAYKGASDYFNRLQSTVESGQDIQQVLSEAKTALSDFHPGAGATVYKNIGQMVQALGGSEDLVNKISNGNLAATQEFQKLMIQTVMGQIKNQMPSGSRLAQYEFQHFMNNNPQIETDPNAINKIFDFWSRLYGRATQEQSEMNTYLKGGGNPIFWPAEWNKRAIKYGYTTLAAPPKAGEAVGNQLIGSPAPSGTSTPPATAPSAPPSANFQFVPGKGLVPVK